MITLETIVESLKQQLRPHLTDDVILHDEWLIGMVNDSRAALMRAMFVSGDNFISFYQDIEIESSDFMPGIQKIALPSKLMEGIGKKNILYFGPDTLFKPTFHYCSFEELINYTYHRFGGGLQAYCDMSDHILFLGEEVAEMSIKAVFEVPNDIDDYDYENSAYPIGANNVRQLEIITFQHIAIKLGMPVDIINDGMDETRNAPVSQQVEQQQRMEQNQQQEQQ